MDELINKGVAVVGENYDSEKKPIVVVGVARGGTSLVAGALSHLGVFMGDRAMAPVFEDVRLSEHFESKDLFAAKRVVDEYTEMHDLWGWKRPSSLNYLQDVDTLLDSPKYIFIFKDVFSIGQRNKISMLSDVVVGMEKAMESYSKILTFIKKNNPSAMFASYDKVIAHSDHFIKSLVSFCNISPSEDQVAAAEKETSELADALDSAIDRLDEALSELDEAECKINSLEDTLHQIDHLAASAV